MRKKNRYHLNNYTDCSRIMSYLATITPHEAINTEALIFVMATSLFYHLSNHAKAVFLLRLSEYCGIIISLHTKQLSAIKQRMDLQQLRQPRSQVFFPFLLQLRVRFRVRKLFRYLNIDNSRLKSIHKGVFCLFLFIYQ